MNESETPMAAVTPKPSKPFARPRVLVVDDEPTLVELIGDVIAGSRINCKLISAGSMAEARDVLATQTIDLLVTDVHLPDGDGMALLPALQRRQPQAGAVVITGAPTVDGAISAMREGAIDFVPKPFSAEQIVERLGRALARQQARAKAEHRLDRLREAVRRLNDARKIVSKKVDLLCNDLITAYGELSRQFDSVRTTEGFRRFINSAQDLEQMLCHAMDWMLRQLGYSNIAVWLAADEGNFQLGAYMKYTIPGEPKLVEAMSQNLVPQVIREGFIHLYPEDLADHLTAAELEHLPDQTIMGMSCTYMGEPLAAVLLFRSASTPFTDEDAATFKALSPVFAATLASAVRGDHEADASPFPDAELEPADDAESDAGQKDARADADWWKRGEPPPF